MTDADKKKTEDIKNTKKTQTDDQVYQGKKKKKETKQEEKPAEPREEKAAGPEQKTREAKELKVSPKLKKVIEEVENLSVIELADLVKALQKRFGVAAASPTVAAAAPAAGPTPASEEPTTEQTTFNVVLAESGANKISVIKIVKELVPDLGLKEAKDLVEATPKQILTEVNKEKAEEAKKKLEEAGAKVEFK